MGVEDMARVWGDAKLEIAGAWGTADGKNGREVAYEAYAGIGPYSGSC